ncbi:hypothetical protein LINPERHAP2_LOCUS14680 [Linum perenne]
MQTNDHHKPIITIEGLSGENGFMKRGEGTDEKRNRGQSVREKKRERKKERQLASARRKERARGHNFNQNRGNFIDSSRLGLLGFFHESYRIQMSKESLRRVARGLDHFGGT